ncbi:hypothetical protein SLA2020_284870 [Shorea laevis]
MPFFLQLVSPFVLSAKVLKIHYNISSFIVGLQDVYGVNLFGLLTPQHFALFAFKIGSNLLSNLISCYEFDKKKFIISKSLQLLLVISFGFIVTKLIMMVPVLICFLFQTISTKLVSNTFMLGNE